MATRIGLYFTSLVERITVSLVGGPSQFKEGDLVVVRDPVIRKHYELKVPMTVVKIYRIVNSRDPFIACKWTEAGLGQEIWRTNAFPESWLTHHNPGLETTSPDRQGNGEEEDLPRHKSFKSTVALGLS